MTKDTTHLITLYNSLDRLREKNCDRKENNRIKDEWYKVRENKIIIEIEGEKAFLGLSKVLLDNITDDEILRQLAE